MLVINSLKRQKKLNMEKLNDRPIYGEATIEQTKELLKKI